MIVMGVNNLYRLSDAEWEKVPSKRAHVSNEPGTAITKKTKAPVLTAKDVALMDEEAANVDSAM